MAQPSARVNKKETVLLICDMQEKFEAEYKAEITVVINRLLDAAKLLNVKVIVSEHEPKTWGHTIPEISLNDVTLVEKTAFSMYSKVSPLLSANVKSVILCGLWAHVCVFNTAMEFLENDYAVHVVVNGCSSPDHTDRMYAYEQMKQAGAVLTTCDTAIYSLCRRTDNGDYDELIKFVADPLPDTGLRP